MGRGESIWPPRCPRPPNNSRVGEPGRQRATARNWRVRAVSPAIGWCRGAGLTEHRWQCTGVTVAERGVDYGYARGIRTPMDRARGARGHRHQPARHAEIRAGQWGLARDTFTERVASEGDLGALPRPASVPGAGACRGPHHLAIRRRVGARVHRPARHVRRSSRRVASRHDRGIPRSRAPAGDRDSLTLEWPPRSRAEASVLSAPRARLLDRGPRCTALRALDAG